MSLDFFEVIKSRRSVKYYNENKKIPADKILEMLNLANSAPSFCNFQPWRYIVVSSEEGKSKLLNANYNTVQNETSSAVIILLGDMNYIDKFHDIYGSAVEKGYMPADVKEDMQISMEALVESMPKETKREIIFYDCGLWSMQFCNIARAEGYDTNILGGFDKEKLIELFDISENLTPIMLISIGEKDKEGRETTRLLAEELVEFK